MNYVVREYSFVFLSVVLWFVMLVCLINFFCYGWDFNGVVYYYGFVPEYLNIVLFFVSFMVFGLIFRRDVEW